MTTDKLSTEQVTGPTAEPSPTTNVLITTPAAQASSDRAAIDRDQRSGKVLVVAVAALIAAVVAYFAFGMPGMDHGAGGGSSMAGMDMSSPTGRHRVVSPDEFEAMLDEGATVINVHVPTEGAIAGTDLTMPYNALDATLLPADASAKLLVYCMTGDMSAEASIALVDLGYTDVVELAGGMESWTDSGRQLLGDS